MQEAEVRVNSIWLAEHETTGPIPVGFEFEQCGTSYDHFDVSTEGFIAFARGAHRARPPARVSLVPEGTRVGGGRVTYEVRGQAPRRRLLVSLAEAGPPGATLRLTVHERTGIVEIGAAGQSFGEPTMRQLDRVQSSPSRVNSALKIG